MASYTRAASIPGFAMALDVSIHNRRMGNGSPTSMARSRASEDACVVNSSQSSPNAYFIVSFFLRHSSGMTGSVSGRFVALYALRMRMLPPGTSTLPVIAMRSQHARFNDMAESLLVHGEAPLDGGRLRGGVQTCRPHDVRFGDAGDLGGPGGRELLHRSGKLFETGAPAIDELVIVQIFVDHDVEPGAGQRAVRARTNLQEVLCTGAPPGQARVDGDDLRTHLHALRQPVANVAVGVRFQRLVSPDHDDAGRHELRIGVAVFVAFGGVGNQVVAYGGERPEQARQIACEAGESERGDVRRLQSAVAEVGHRPGVAASAVDEQDGVAAVLVPHLAHLALADVEGLVPADAFPLVLAAFAYALHGILQPVGIVHRFGHVKATDAQLAIDERAERISLHLFELAVLDVQQQPARVVATRRRPVIGARDGVAILFQRNSPSWYALRSRFSSHSL